jgi:hypothetical protein
MAQLTGFYHEFLAELGNEPGQQQGDVTVLFVNPVDGAKEITGPSGALTIAAEAGSIVGVLVHLDGRRMFIPGTNIAGIVDTAKKEKNGKTANGSSDTSS